MSPAYQRDVVRVDLYWYARNDVDPAEEFYVQFWDLFAPLKYTLHWGKYMPTLIGEIRWMVCRYTTI